MTPLNDLSIMHRGFERQVAPVEGARQFDGLAANAGDGLLVDGFGVIAVAGAELLANLFLELFEGRHGTGVLERTALPFGGRRFAAPVTTLLLRFDIRFRSVVDEHFTLIFNLVLIIDDLLNSFVFFFFFVAEFDFCTIFHRVFFSRLLIFAGDGSLVRRRGRGRFVPRPLFSRRPPVDLFGGLVIDDDLLVLEVDVVAVLPLSHASSVGAVVAFVDDGCCCCCCGADDGRRRVVDVFVVLVIVGPSVVVAVAVVALSGRPPRSTRSRWTRTRRIRAGHGFLNFTFLGKTLGER